MDIPNQKKVNNCVICNDFISKNNNSREHLIPNSIGGKKIIEGFICKKCNNATGNEWDSELAKGLNFFCTFFNIKRDRGEVQSVNLQTPKGESIKMKPNGALTLTSSSFSFEEKSCQINYEMPDNLTKKEIRKNLGGIQRKCKNSGFDVSIDELDKNLKKEASYSTDKVEWQINLYGSVGLRKSIIKSLLCLVFVQGIQPKDCEHIYKYLSTSENIDDKKQFLNVFYSKDLLQNRLQEVPFHLISVKGCEETNQLLGYIEFFGCLRWIVHLSSNYKGKTFSRSYGINPITGEELSDKQLEINLSFSNQEIEELCNLVQFSDDAIRQLKDKFLEAFKRVAEPKNSELLKQEIETVLTEATDFAFLNCGAKEDDILTPENIKQIQKRLMEKITPFILHCENINNLNNR